jgi:hypothetical protein
MTGKPHVDLFGLACLAATVQLTFLLLREWRDRGGQL